MKKQYLLDLKQKPFNYVKEEKLHQILMPDESGNTEVYLFVVSYLMESGIIIY